MLSETTVPPCEPGTGFRHDRQRRRVAEDVGRGGGGIGTSHEKETRKTLTRIPCSLLCLLVAGQGILGALPRREEIERTELGNLHRFVDDALELVVVANFHIARHREVLPQRMAVEAVVGQDPAQVGVTVEEDPVHVERFALEPVGDREHRRGAGNGGVLVGLDLEAHAMVLHQ
jgi:hypothetical protein